MGFLHLFGGLVLLLGGAELLVRGAGRIALALHIPVMVVALTIVAFGTSMPELIVSLFAAAEGKPELSLANVTGSNTANIALVLGLAAMVRPLAVGRDLMRREVPAALLLQLMIPVMLIDGGLSRVDGGVLLLTGVGYNALLMRDAFAGRAVPDDADDLEAGGTWLANGLMVLGGGVGLWLGAEFFVMGAVSLAEWMGFSDRVIGLTVVALGTSAPEAVTAMVSAARDEADMAVGNSLGSNILNISMVLGTTAMVHPIILMDRGAFADLAVAMMVALMLIPIVLRGAGLSRVEGGMLVGAYAVYLLTLTIV